MKMMRLLILGLLLACLSTTALSEELWKIASHHKGRLYYALVTGEMFEKAPAWKPESGRDVPLAVNKAIALTTAAVKNLLGPQEFKKWHVKSIGLWPISSSKTTKWFYVIRWQPPRAGPQQRVNHDNREGFTLLVTLAGDCARPVLEKKRK